MLSLGYSVIPQSESVSFRFRSIFHFESLQSFRHKKKQHRAKLGEDYKETQGSELCMHDAGSSAELQFNTNMHFTSCKHFFNTF